MNFAQIMKAATVVFMLGASQAYADDVECWAKVHGKKNVMNATIADDGTFARTSNNGWVETQEDTIFSWMAMDPTRAGAEYYDTFKAPNGYSIVKMGTSANEMKIGVSADRTKGFYEYTDHGSSANNAQIVLTCKKI